MLERIEARKNRAAKKSKLEKNEARKKRGKEKSSREMGISEDDVFFTLSGTD